MHTLGLGRLVGLAVRSGQSFGAPAAFNALVDTGQRPGKGDPLKDCAAGSLGCVKASCGMGRSREPYWTAIGQGEVCRRFMVQVAGQLSAFPGTSLKLLISHKTITPSLLVRTPPGTMVPQAENRCSL